LKPVSSLRLFGAVMAGYGVATLFPLGISPFVRAWLVARLEGLRMAGVLMTTAIERFLDGIVFALFAAFTAFAGQIPQTDGDVRIGLIIAGEIYLVVFGGLFCGLLLGLPQLQGDQTRWNRGIGWGRKQGRTTAGRAESSDPRRYNLAS